jgi:hypothetical protein
MSRNGLLNQRDGSFLAELSHPQQPLLVARYLPPGLSCFLDLAARLAEGNRDTRPPRLSTFSGNSLQHLKGSG